MEKVHLSGAFRQKVVSQFLLRARGDQKVVGMAMAAFLLKAEENSANYARAQRVLDNDAAILAFIERIRSKYKDEIASLRREEREKTQKQINEDVQRKQDESLALLREVSHDSKKMNKRLDVWLPRIHKAVSPKGVLVLGVAASLIASAIWGVPSFIKEGWEKLTKGKAARSEPEKKETTPAAAPQNVPPLRREEEKQAPVVVPPSDPIEKGPEGPFDIAARRRVVFLAAAQTALLRGKSPDAILPARRVFLRTGRLRLGYRP